MKIAFASSAGNIDWRGWGRSKTGLVMKATVRSWWWCRYVWRHCRRWSRAWRIWWVWTLKHLAAIQQSAVGAVDDLRSIVVVVTAIVVVVVAAAIVVVKEQMVKVWSSRRQFVIFWKLRLFFDWNMRLWRCVTRVLKSVWRKFDGKSILTQDLVGIDCKWLLIWRKTDGRVNERLVQRICLTKLKDANVSIWIFLNVMLWFLAL